MDIAELRSKLDNIAAELAEQDVQQEEIAIEEHHEKDEDGNVIPHDDISEEEVEEEAVEEEAVEEAMVEIPVQELADIMQLAGYSDYAERIQEYANEPDEQYMDAEEQLVGLSGGLNGPKTMHPPAADGDNPMDTEPREVEETMEAVEDKLYKSYQAFLEEEEIKVETE